MNNNSHLRGRVFINFGIRALTGLHIGGASTGLEIGGVDNPVIRNPISNEPYIPGSSLRGKMRSLLEKSNGLVQNSRIAPDVKIHSCDNPEDYDKDGGCKICHIFGVSGKGNFKGHSLLLVRDIPLSRESVGVLTKAYIDLDFTELKTEVAIDRVTSAATPRTLERVPAGAVFEPAELVFSVYQEEDFGRLRHVIDGLQLIEDDYLGGYGSRGSGKVKFEDITIAARSSQQYGELKTFIRTFPNLQELEASYPEILSWAKSVIQVTE